VTDLPPGWAVASVSRVGTIVTGSTPPTGNPRNWNGKIPFVTPGDMKHLGTVSNAERSVTMEGAQLGRMLPPGAVLVTCIGNLGRTSVTTCACLTNQQINAIVPVPEIDSRFVAYACATPRFQQQLVSISTSTTVPLVNKGNFARMEIPVAPRLEQERIVAAIEEQFSRIDAGLAALDRVRQNLSRIRDAIRFAATRGKLVPQDPSDEPAASMIERVKPTGRFRGEATLPNDLGPIPNGWSWALMGRLARRVTVGHVGPMKDEYVPHGIPFLRSQNVREDRFSARGLLFISELFHERLKKSRLMPGDLVIVRSGNVGMACVVPDSLGEANCADLVIVQGPEALDPHYAALYMNSLARSRVRAGRVGVALMHFNTQSVAELPVPVPPMSEQRRIVTEAGRLMSVVDALEAALSEELRRVAALRSAILVSAFSGKLVPQDPTDEPASTLLERIIAQRLASNGDKNTRSRKPSTKVTV
jgi:type I restriction enzyme S subunit